MEMADADEDDENSDLDEYVLCKLVGGEVFYILFLLSADTRMTKTHPIRSGVLRSNSFPHS